MTGDRKKYKKFSIIIIYLEKKRKIGKSQCYFYLCRTQIIFSIQLVRKCFLLMKKNGVTVALLHFSIQIISKRSYIFCNCSIFVFWCFLCIISEKIYEKWLHGTQTKLRGVKHFLLFHFPRFDSKNFCVLFSKIRFKQLPNTIFKKSN